MRYKVVVVSVLIRFLLFLREGVRRCQWNR